MGWVSGSHSLSLAIIGSWMLLALDYILTHIIHIAAS